MKFLPQGFAKEDFTNLKEHIPGWVDFKYYDDGPFRTLLRGDMYLLLFGKGKVYGNLV